MRISTSASTLGSGSSVSSLRSAGGNVTTVQTVGSIHDTGMRVVSHSDVARDSLKPLPVSSPSTTTSSLRT